MTKEEKEKLIGHLTEELPALRGTVKVTQDNVANAIGQTKTEIWQDEPKINWRAEDIFQNTSDSSKRSHDYNYGFTGPAGITIIFLAIPRMIKETLSLPLNRLKS